MINEGDFMRPLWRRIALMAFCVAWLGWEIYRGEGLWIAIAGGMTVYGAWIYLIAYKPPAPPAAPTPSTDEEGS
ncbi:MAG: DUF3329 domain-containing protein [Rhizobiaceae bacterium]